MPESTNLRLLTLRAILRFVPFLISTAVLAQTQTPFVTGLRAPVKLIFTTQRNLIVAEEGDTPNSGRISLIDRTSGTRRTLIDGLPSALYTAQGQPQPSGPDGIALGAGGLYVTIGSGDVTVAGPVPGSDIPNPAGPGSPIFSSVLLISPDHSFDVIKGDFTLHPGDHATLKTGASVTLTNSSNEALYIKLVADFPDYVPDPRPDFADNVRISNPFGVVARGQTLYVVDAGMNIVRQVDTTTGTYTTLATWPALTNPTPVGPSRIDAVPDSLRFKGDDLLVTNLTGFPFPSGLAEVRGVNTTTGAMYTVLGGLTSAIDVDPTSGLLILEFSTNMLTGAPGRLQQFGIIKGVWYPSTLIADNLITPTNMAADPMTGDIFVTNIGPGMITRIANAIPIYLPGPVIPGIASTAGAFGSRWVTTAQFSNPYPFSISGRIVFHPAGVTGQNSDPSLSYVLTPHETKSYSDLVSAAGGAGLGSADIITEVGGAPVAVVRVIDAASPNNVSAQIPLVDRAQAIAAQKNNHGLLVTPTDANWRFNVGLRTLESGAFVRIDLHDASGDLVKSVTKTYPPNYLVQLPIDDLVGTPVGANNSVAFLVGLGSAIIYGSGVENNGQGMTFQLASPTSEQ